MKKLQQILSKIASLEKRWFLPLAVSTMASFFLLVVIFNLGNAPAQSTLASILSSLSMNQVPASQKPSFVDSKFQNAPVQPPKSTSPRLAYLIAGSRRDGNKLKRTLAAVYHPRNYYILHLDLKSEPAERADLAEHIRNMPIYAKVGNVQIITKSNMITYRGPTMVANTLHAIALLLRKSKEWDWFINLSASDYPLVTQDGMCFSLLVTIDIR
eukprot:TRINITY_DN15537_c0_g1_i1.p1 TRINITY_DN15537_c0_g1~~TRINITY_DN15537_c0_g1_i1.p1  ORF type:complete len:213 (-),score=36.14 TRINITY_DN15537_c0_g1_i1:173-811(-)